LNKAQQDCSNLNQQINACDYDIISRLDHAFQVVDNDLPLPLKPVLKEMLTRHYDILKSSIQLEIQTLKASLCKSSENISTQVEQLKTELAPILTKLNALPQLKVIKEQLEEQQNDKKIREQLEAKIEQTQTEIEQCFKEVLSQIDCYQSNANELNNALQEFQVSEGITVTAKLEIDFCTIWDTLDAQINRVSNQTVKEIMNEKRKQIITLETFIVF